MKRSLSARILFFSQAVICALFPESAAICVVFPPGAAAEVCAVRGKNRARQLCDQVVVSFPPANSCGDRPRAFDYEVTVESDGRTLLVRRVFSTRAYWAEALDTEPVRCVFGRSELPEGRSVTFMVRPVNDYGRFGAPLPSVTFVV